MKVLNSKVILVSLLSILLIFSLSFSSCGEKKKEYELGDNYKNYVNAIDTDYALELARTVIDGEEYQSNTFFGDRTAGSTAEKNTANFIKDTMEEIGLTDVKMEPFKVDTWTIGDSTLSMSGLIEPIKLHSYAANGTGDEGINAEIVPVGKGTKADYDELESKGVSVRGKIVLVEELNQLDDWWITWPMREAYSRGAAAVLACSTKGFSEFSKDAYNANDMCGPSYIPTVSITVNDKEKVLAEIKKENKRGQLIVKNTVGDGTSHNIVGKIRGRSSENPIIIGAHYDAYFSGFQDDTIAWAGVLAMAKAYKDARYTPMRDMYFYIHGSEEWGISDTDYDWATGAYNMINKMHKELIAGASLFVNFELPAYEFSDTFFSYAAPELYSAIKDFNNNQDQMPPISKDYGCYAKGASDTSTQTYTYSDDFSYYLQGVPTIINGFLNDQEGNRYDFYRNYYHTNFDTEEETYNEGVFNFNLAYYGSFAIYMDKRPVLNLNINTQIKRVKEALDKDVISEAGIDLTNYNKEIDSLAAEVKVLNKKISSTNKEYFKALSEDKSDEELLSYFENARPLNKSLLKISKKIKDVLVALSYEEPVIPHEVAQNNIVMLNQAIAYLQKGGTDAATSALWGSFAEDNLDEDGETPLDAGTALFNINAFGGWYATSFSKAVMDEWKAMNYSDGNKNNQAWGTGRIFEYVEIDDVIRYLVEAENNPEITDFSAQISSLRTALAKEKSRLKAKIAAEEKGLKEITALVKAAAL